MTLKIGLLVLALLAGWFMVRRALGREDAGGGGAPRRPAIPDAAPAVRCPDCGVHHLPGSPCGCAGGR